MNKVADLHLGTSISGWGRAVLLALQALGIDGRQVFLDCGLNPDDQGKSHIRNPVAKMQHVWQIAESSVADSAILAEKITQYLNASSFHALGFGLYASHSIEDLLNRLCAYREVISSSVMMSTLKTKNEFIFAIEDLRPVKSHITSDVLTLFILKICRELCGPEFSPTAVEVPWSEGQYTASFKKLTQAPLLCEAENYALRFSRAAVEIPLPSANAQLANYQDKLCNDYLHSLSENQHLSLRVKLRVLQTLGSGDFSIDHIASSLNMSARTLQRKLKEEQTSFHRLREEARKELVLEYLQNPELSATQITYMLGFSNLPSFSSAFRSWFGRTFTECRSRF